MIRSYEERKHSVTVVCCGMLSVTGFVTGIVTALGIGLTCGTGYLFAGGISGTSFFLLKNMAISKELEKQVDLLQSENREFKSLNKNLKENNRQLEEISEGLPCESACGKCIVKN